MKLTDPLQMVKGVGPKNAELFKSAGLLTINDLIDYWPRKYEDYGSTLSIATMAPGLVTIKGQFTNIRARHSRRGLHMTEALLSDLSGSVKIVWFNQPYRASSIKTGEEYFVSGEFALKSRSMTINNPRVELAKEISDSDTILPIYKETKGLNSNLVRKVVGKIESVFSEIEETLPLDIIKKEKLFTRAEALKTLHMPDSSEALKQAKMRLGFEEVFQMQLAGALTREELLKEKSPEIEFRESVAKDFVSHLPYELTPDQKRTVWQIYKDIAEKVPMNRLVEGDVGSGKTVVACMAAVMAMEAGYQVTFMAPTEILARQHAENLSSLLAHTRWSSLVGLLVGSLKPVQKKVIHERIASGDCRLVVGTNALIQDKVVTSDVGLVIIDEQHRFGVEQRTRLRTKAGLYPHVLCMTATPIPRTLALTLYGELSITQLTSMPSGRVPVDTEVILPSSRSSLYRTIDEKLAEGRQAFFVCPLIEPNPELKQTSAKELYKKLSSGPFKHRSVGLLHGSLKSEEKDAVMAAFKAGKTDLLVSTTVIEVGVDVPNATVMVIESAERFGLAQIHQLRGRVGRGGYPGFCYLIPSDEQSMSKRLSVLSYVTDGFRLSEIDLELRGPGAIYGVRQSGALDLRIADLGDEPLILRAKAAAALFVQRHESLLKYRVLAERVNHFRSIRKLN